MATAFYPVALPVGLRPSIGLGCRARAATLHSQSVAAEMRQQPGGERGARVQARDFHSLCVDSYRFTSRAGEASDPNGRGLALP
eukprot:3396348-Pleurochrysis_carterae.AAC.1